MLRWPWRPRPIHLPHKPRLALHRRSRNQKLHPILNIRRCVPAQHPILTLQIQHEIKMYLFGLIVELVIRVWGIECFDSSAFETDEDEVVVVFGEGENVENGRAETHGRPLYFCILVSEGSSPDGVALGDE